MDETALSQQPYLTFFESDTAEYDVIVDQSSSAPNLKEATWGAIQPLLSIVGPMMGPEEMALILEYSPMPESFLEKFKALQEQKAQQPPPPDPEMMKLEAQMQAKQAELQMKAQADQQSAQMEVQKAQMQLQIEREKAQQEMQIAAAKAQQEMALAEQKMQHEMRLKAMQMQVQAQVQLRDAEVNTALKAKESDDAAVARKSDSDTLSKLVDSFSKNSIVANQELAKGIIGLGENLKEAITKPKKIVRGKDGRAEGVE